MYEKTARYYDIIYGFKDYASEAVKIRAIVERENPGARSLLDVACGSGKHIEQLRQWYQCAGVDYVPEFVEIARNRNPGIRIEQGDFRSFDLGQTFDAVTCMFSAIGYADSVAGLNSAIACMANHLVKGGVLMVEPWFSPGAFFENHVHMVTIDEPRLKIARVNNSRVENGKSVMDMHHVIGTPEEVFHFVENHTMFLFSKEEYLAAFEAAGLDAKHDPEGIIGRGLYIGIKR